MATDPEYMLYVTNLPIELNEVAIRQIFNEYGTVTSLMKLPCATWAYIKYASYGEADSAIRELNDKKPLNLKVALAKDSFSPGEELRPNASVVFERSNSADSPPNHNDGKYQSIGRGQSINVPREHVVQVGLPYRCVDYGASASSLPYPHTLGIHEVEDRYANTSQLWSRGVITVTPDGKRHVSLGRGYTLYELPEPYPKIEEHISKVYEQRNKELYQYSEDKLKNGVKNCSVCSTKTMKHCEKCLTYYCSKACQLDDWSRHKAECERIPALVEDMNEGISSLQINQDVSQTRRSSVANVVNKTAKSSDVKLRRPNTLVENSPNTSSNINMHKNKTDVACTSMSNGTRPKHSTDQRDNGIAVPPPKKTDKLVDVTNVKENFQPDMLHKCSNANENSDQMRKNGYPSTSSVNQDRHSRNYQSDSNRSSFNREKCNNDKVRDKTCNNRNYSPRENSFPSNKDSTGYNGKESTGGQGPSTASVNNDLAFYKDTHLSKTKFTTVEVVIPLGNGEYWINKVEDKTARDSLMVKLQKVAQESRNVRPIIGEIYGVLYATVWHRAIITALNPIKVQFIDYGNEEILREGDEIRDIGDLVKAPKFARKIRLTRGTSDKYTDLQETDEMSVRMLSIDSEKTITVEVQEQSESSSPRTMESPSNKTVKKLPQVVPQEVPQENCQVSQDKDTKVSTLQIPNVFDALAATFTHNALPQLEINGLIQISELMQKNVYSAMLTPETHKDDVMMLLGDLQTECSEVQTTADYKPKSEELVCGWFGESDGWARGYVSVCSEPSSSLSIIKIDEAKVQSTDKIVPCPKKYHDICAFGVICEANQSIQIKRDENVYNFRAVLNEKNFKQESLKIEIASETNPEVFQVVVRPWKYTDLLNSSPSVELKNGSKICLTSYRNHFNMFARSLDEEQVDYYNHVMQSIARYAQTAPYLTEPPVRKQIVIAPFDDGNSYRAMIHKTENDKATIIYIDFGNIDIVDIKQLKAMPQSHSLKQSCSARITLKDVPQDVPSNQEVDIYIRNLVGKEVPLTCTYDGTIKDGVCLTMPTGECVNDKINELLIPGWKREIDDKKCYMLSDLSIASLGNVGETVDALILFIPSQMRYMMGPYDIQLITHIIEVMSEMLSEYAKKAEFYIPRAQELCVALYEDKWYRALCINPKESYTKSLISFVDYGNMELVNHKDIRVMPKDFIVPAAMANMCTVVNLAPVDSKGNYSKAVQEKLNEMVQSNSCVKIKIVEKSMEDGEYKVELPVVRSALMKLGLV